MKLICNLLERVLDVFGEMANYGDCLIAICDGKSRGTKHMIDIAKKKGLKLFIFKVENEK